MSNFIHLHTHTNEGSYMDAPVKICDLVKEAKRQGMSSLAITDHGNIAGWNAFNKVCTEEGIKPIFGVEIYESVTTNAKEKIVEKKKKKKKEGKLEDTLSNKNNFHLVLLARDEEGMQYIREAVTYANGDGMKYKGKGRIDTEYMMKNRTKSMDHVICLTACIGGKVGSYLSEAYDLTLIEPDREQYFVNEAHKKVKTYLNTLSYAYGKENVFIELQKHDISRKEFDALSVKGQDSVVKLVKVEEMVRTFAYDNQNIYNFVATNDVHYLKPEDQHLRNITVNMSYGGMNHKEFLTDGKGIFDCHFKTEEEMRKNFPSLAIDNTKLIDSRIKQIEIEASKDYHFPKITDGNSIDALRNLTYSKGKKLLGRDFTEEEIERLEYELSVINERKATDYFLIQEDMIAFAKKSGIPYRPRGSAGSSLVLYCLNVTDVHPFEYDLIFERFMNPDRVTQPDIDMDFSSKGQNQVRDYAINKYGAEKVALVRAYGTWQGTGVMKKMGKIFNESASERISDISKRLKKYDQNDLSELLKIDSELKELYETSSEYKVILDLALSIQGLTYNETTHAGGVIIGDSDLVNFGTITFDEKAGKPVLNLDKDGLKDAKLTKFDVLSVTVLDVIYGTLGDLGLTDEIFDHSDKEVFEWMHQNPEKMFSAFQLSAEGSGIIKFLNEAKPSNIMELSDIISMYRPGPMKYLNSYVARKLGKEPVVYLHEDLIPILKDTYGIVIYQEQVLQIVRTVAGFSYAEADVLRKAISDKDFSVMVERLDMFVKQGQERGYSNEFLTKLAKDIIDFVLYAFNKPHGVNYAKTCFETVKLIKDYPHEWYKNLLSVKGETRYFQNILEHESDRVPVSGLSVLNSSYEPSIIIKNSVRQLDFGFSSIKGVSSDISCIENSNRTFTSLGDVLKETKLSKGNFEKLVLSGVLDEFSDSRAFMIANYTNLLKGKATVEAEPMEKFEEYFLEAGLVEYKAIDFSDIMSDTELLTIEESKDDIQHNTIVGITGFISDIKETTMKNGKPMVFYKIKDSLGVSWNIVNFNPKRSDLSFDKIKSGLVTIKGKFNAEHGSINAYKEAGHKLFYETPKTKPSVKQKEANSTNLNFERT